MRLAVIYDFDMPVDIRREGIGVYVKNLLYFLLKYDKDIHIELWFYSFNDNYVRELFADSIDEFGERVHLCHERMCDDSIYYGYRKKLWAVKKIFYTCLYRTTCFEKFLRKAEKYSNSPYLKDKSHAYSLLETIEKKSKADVAYSFFVTFKHGLAFNKPCVMQVHDLFTLQLRELFLQSIPNVDELNQDIVKNLTEYADKGTKFVCSSSYVAKNHLLKYVPCHEENVHIIPFPPMIKKVNSGIASKEDIYRKFDISGKYIFYASQNRPNKNLIVLLKAIHHLQQQNISIKLVTTGTVCAVPVCKDFADSTEIKKLIREIGSVSEEDLYSLYVHSSAVVVPTIIEGYGMSGQALEALSVKNIPVIHGKSLGMEESLASAGLSYESADLNWFELDDYHDLANKIVDIMKDPASHIKKQKHILGHYTAITWEDTAKRYLSLFNSLV